MLVSLRTAVHSFFVACVCERRINRSVIFKSCKSRSFIFRPSSVIFRSLIFQSCNVHATSSVIFQSATSAIPRKPAKSALFMVRVKFKRDHRDENQLQQTNLPDIYNTFAGRKQEQSETGKKNLVRLRSPYPESGTDAWLPEINANFLVPSYICGKLFMKIR